MLSNFGSNCPSSKYLKSQHFFRNFRILGNVRKLFSVIKQTSIEDIRVFQEDQYFC